LKEGWQKETKRIRISRFKELAVHFAILVSGPPKTWVWNWISSAALGVNTVRYYAEKLKVASIVLSKTFAELAFLKLKLEISDSRLFMFHS
jgi:hypothetical protein